MFDNYIEGPIPEFIQNLTNLTDLRLYGMKLQGPIPQNFSKLINLENLMLGDLEGNYTSFVFVENWANLSTLSLRKCGLTGQLLSPPRNLPKLKYLDLTSNNLSGSIKLLLQYKDSLNFIYVGNNSFSERLPPEIIQPSVPLNDLPFDW
jgi:Leucine-rich repeat (LRR) protein